MAKYVPISPAAIIPGIAGTDAAWAGLITNTIRLYSDGTDLGYSPVIAAGSLVAIDETVLEVTGTTPVEVCRITVPVNSDNQKLRCYVQGNVDSGDTGRWTLAYGGATAVGSTTSTVKAAVDVTVTPTGSGQREAVLSVAGAAGSDVVRTYSALFYLHTDAAAATTPMPSGVIETVATLYTSNEPVTTERVMRLLNTATMVAKDRPACVFSMIEHVGFAGVRSGVVASGATPVLVARSLLLPVEDAPRDYRVSMYLTRDGSGVANCTVNVGGQAVTATAMGWTHGTVTLGGTTTLKMEAWLKKTSGSDNVYLKTLQIMRED